MAREYNQFLKPIIGVELQSNKNKRDGIRNMMVTRDKARKLAAVLYTGGISLARKELFAQKMIAELHSSIEEK